MWGFLRLYRNVKGPNLNRPLSNTKVVTRYKRQKNHLPPKKPDKFCNGRNGRGGYCANVAGKGTNHKGRGRCSDHGGNAGRPNRYGIAKNRRPQGLVACIEYYQSGEGRAMLHDIDVQLARFNGLWHYITQLKPQETGEEIDVEVKDLVKLLAETAKVVHKEKQLQIDKALKLSEWYNLADEIVAAFARQIESYLYKRLSLSRLDARGAADAIVQRVKSSWDEVG